MFLTKSDYKAGRQCPTKLYYKKHRYPSLKEDNPYLAFLADGGYMAEAMAKLMIMATVSRQLVSLGTGPS